jgi:hypothetical protein
MVTCLSVRKFCCTVSHKALGMTRNSAVLPNSADTSLTVQFSFCHVVLILAQG